jgi:hypothetical protein
MGKDLVSSRLYLRPSQQDLAGALPEKFQFVAFRWRRLFLTFGGGGHQSPMENF